MPKTVCCERGAEKSDSASEKMKTRKHQHLREASGKQLFLIVSIFKPVHTNIV